MGPKKLVLAYEDLIKPILAIRFSASFSILSVHTVESLSTKLYESMQCLFSQYFCFSVPLVVNSQANSNCITASATVDANSESQQS